jgi:hypothetical protein
VDEGEAMRLLLEKLAHNRAHPLSSYTDKLLAAFTQLAGAQKAAHPVKVRAIIHQKLDMIEPLSERELEVLKLLRSELSGPEIAQKLVVSLNTLRTHTGSHPPSRRNRFVLANFKSPTPASAGVLKPSAEAFIYQQSPPQSHHVVMTPHQLGRYPFDR